MSKEEKLGALLQRKTIQVPEAFYKELKRSAAKQRVPKYELITKLLVLGAREWSRNKRKEYAIDLKSPEVALAIDISKMPDLVKSIKA